MLDPATVATPTVLEVNYSHLFFIGQKCWSEIGYLFWLISARYMISKLDCDCEVKKPTLVHSTKNKSFSNKIKKMSSQTHTHTELTANINDFCLWLYFLSSGLFWGSDAASLQQNTLHYLTGATVSITAGRIVKKVNRWCDNTVGNTQGAGLFCETSMCRIGCSVWPSFNKNKPNAFIP